jgi:hypothetical protein
LRKLAFGLAVGHRQYPLLVPPAHMQIDATAKVPRCSASTEIEG